MSHWSDGSHVAGRWPHRWICGLRKAHRWAWWFLDGGDQLGICAVCGERVRRPASEVERLRRSRELYQAGERLRRGYAEVGTAIQPFVAGLAGSGKAMPLWQEAAPDAPAALADPTPAPRLEARYVSIGAALALILVCLLAAYLRGWL